MSHTEPEETIGIVRDEIGAVASEKPVVAVVRGNSDQLERLCSHAGGTGPMRCPARRGGILNPCYREAA